MSNIEIPTAQLPQDSVTVAPGICSADELLRMAHDEMRRELINGVVHTMTPAGFEHGRMAAALHWRLAAFVAEHRLGSTFAAETGFLLATNPDTLRAPDIAFIRADRIRAIANPQGFFPGSPDLAVEVVSPYDTYSRVLAKAQMWLDHGSQQVWIVDPESRQVAVYRCGGNVELFQADQTMVVEDLFPGWQLKLSELFEST